MGDTPEKSKIYSEIMRDIGQVIFAAVVVGPLVSGSVSLITFYGLFLSAVAWHLSTSFIKE